MNKQFRLKTVLLLSILLGSGYSYAQNIVTIAGNHTVGFSGDGGSASSAAINAPSGITVTSGGVMYFCDQANNRVRKVSTGGIISTVAGNGTPGAAGDGGQATAANLDNPMGVAVDGSGNVYIADYNNAKVRKVSTSGIITTLTGNGSPGYSADGTTAAAAAISKPTGIAVDGSGNVYIAEQNNHIIRKISTTGYISTVAGNRSASFSGDGGAATAASISYPVGVCFDASGNMIIVDNGNGRIRKVSTAGIISTIAGNGSSGFSGDGGAATAASFNNMSSAAFDASGNLLISDQNNYRIRKVTTSGTISTIAGTGSGGYTGDGGAATACTFYRPSGIAVYSGNIYVTDLGNSAVRLIGTATVSHAPSFNGGSSQTLTVCNGSTTAINSLMAITDIDFSQTETWTVTTSPAHGSLTGFSLSAASTGSVVTPTGLNYVSTSGYSGTDSFRISVSDGSSSASTVVVVTAVSTPAGGAISGPTHACVATRSTFTSSGTSGGTWSTSNPSVAYADGTGPGVILHSAAGVVTISYTVTNACGTAGSTKADTALALPALSTITGTASLTIGTSSTFTASITGGVWSSSNTSVATVSTTGVVTAVSAGAASIYYTLTNSCGPTRAQYDITVTSTTTSSVNIYNFAGNGSSGYRSTDNYAGSSIIYGPTSVAKDKNGYIYFAELGNNIIRKVNKRTGALSLVAGSATSGYSGDGGAATAARMNIPAGVAVDKAGNVYIADQGNARIRKVSTSNIITTIAGTGTIGYTADGSSATSANIASPLSVAVDTFGNVYFAEQNNHRIRKISTSGILTTAAGNGGASFSGDGGAATAAGISYPSGVWLDAASNIYIADAGNNRIRKVTSAGIISTVAGSSTSGYTGDGGAATAAKLFNPSGVTTDSLGNIYIADRNNNVVRKVTTAGIISTVAGTGTSGYSGDGAAATAARLYYPQGVVCDSTNIYIADYGNSAIRVVGKCAYRYARPVASNPVINLGVCRSSSAKRLDTLLAVTDSNVGATDTWSIKRAPAHGTLTGFSYGRGTTGGLIMPSSLYYTPTSGYSGTDTFTIKVANLGDSTFIYAYVNIAVPVTLATITGPSTVNITAPVILSDSTVGGTWSSSNTAIATIAPTGILVGITTGSATITYSYSNGCGASTATKAITIGNVIANPNIYSFAGNGSSGYMNPMLVLIPSGSLWGPSGIAKDNAGNFMYSEQYNLDVNFISRDAYTFYRELGPGTGFVPAGLAFDKNNTKYVADYGNAKILKLPTASSAAITYGTGTAGFTADGAAATSSNLGQPWSIAVDTNGNIYYTEHTYNRVRKINGTTGILTTLAGNGTSAFSGDGGAATAAALSAPMGVWADKYGNVFIADAGNNRIRKVNAAGIISTVAGNGSVGFSGDGGAATSATLNNPFGVTTDSVGGIYIADKNNNRVRKVSVTGIISTIAGTGTAGYSGDDMPATAAQLSAPQGVLCDGSDLYILDYGNNTIRVIGNIYYPHTPPTTRGTAFYPSTCSGGSISLDSLCAVSNTDQGITDTWRQAVAPVHGTLSGFPLTATPSGYALITPSGLTYTATAGYTGADSFTITVGDRYGHATIKFYPTVATTPTVSAISGASTVAISTPITLTDATTGGIWTSTNTARATVSATGQVRGITVGVDTIKYSITNTCGAATAIKVITVTAGRGENPGTANTEDDRISIYPNPTSAIINIALPPATDRATITLTDLEGRMITQTTTTNQLHQLDVSSLPVGTYIIKIITDKQLYTEKVVIWQ